MREETLILGAGVTGLAAGMASGLPVLEATGYPGGICRSYYMVPGTDQPLAAPPNDGNAYRFEFGGGHWVFGGDPTVTHLIASLVPLVRRARRSSVFFPDSRRYVTYPIQNHLRQLGEGIAQTVLVEMARPRGPVTTMAEWLRECFGPTLNRLFFAPFHQLYTAGIYTEIAPQDTHKTPVDFALALRGAFEETPAVGYNVEFVYPKDGLDQLVRLMAQRCRIEYARQVVHIDCTSRVVEFADGTKRCYRSLLSTLPLNRVMAMSGLRTASRPDPFTSVLVLNLGATKGAACPADHWLYVPRSAAGFHRVGFYSNVDEGFLPALTRGRNERVAIYVERAFSGGQRPSPDGINAYCRAVIRELREWDMIGAVEAARADWIDVAYTWSWPGSTWRTEAMAILQAHGIYQIGRYGRWVFQGIADSIRDGLAAGASFRALRDH